MNQYYKLSNDKINYFHPLLSCFENICSCSMGLCFPYCLFGRIYEKAQFGKCWVGCCKYLMIQLFINAIFTSFIYSAEWNILLKDQYDFFNKQQICKTNSSCTFDFTINENCSVNTTDICECSKTLAVNKCNYDNNVLPDKILHFINWITIISIINIITLSSTMGLFLGHYRTKISHKYNILNNSRYNFLIHCIPFTNQCALCQEYNTIEEIETIKPLIPTNITL